MYTWISLVELENKATGATASAQPTIDGKLFMSKAIPWVEARIDEETHQTFAPLIDTRFFDAIQDNVDFYRNLLFLDYPLLSASAVAINDNALTIWDGVQANKSTADYYYHRRGQTPYYTLQGLKNVSTWSPGQYSATTGGWADVTDAIAVTGTWGYRNRYTAEGWQVSGDTVEDSPLSSSATAITVNDGDNFSPGMLLQIESEWVSVTAVDTVLNTVTVLRGWRGSTAAVHVQNTPISIWWAEPNIQRAATRWCAYLYHRRGVYAQYQIAGAGASATLFPQDVPGEIAGILSNYELNMFRSMVV